MSRRRAYPTDLTDAQWVIIEALLPPPRRGGRPEKHPRRAIVDAILYVVRTGCSWRQLPTDFPPWRRRVLVLHRLGAGEGDPRGARGAAR
jgi:transposase